MWTCPKCGRDFQRTNQSHFCGKAPENVSEYIDLQPLEARSRLTEMMLVLRNSVPDVRERILWRMPYYEKDGKSVSFSACKEYVSLYAGAEAIREFASELDEFVTRKNAICFPYDKALPAGLIADIVKWCFR